MTYRVDILAFGETRWASNALRFDTPQEAADYARDLWSRWMLVDKASVVPSDTEDRMPFVEGARELVRFGSEE